MRILKDEEMADVVFIFCREKYDKDKTYSQRELHNAIAKAQDAKTHQQDIKDFEGWLRTNLNAEYCAVPFPLWEEPSKTKLKSMMCIEMESWNNIFESLKQLVGEK